MCGDTVRPIRVVWSDNDGETSVGWGGLHKLLAQDPALGLAVLRSLKEWEHGRMCSIEALQAQSMGTLGRGGVVGM